MYAYHLSVCEKSLDMKQCKSRLISADPTIFICKMSDLSGFHWVQPLFVCEACQSLQVYKYELLLKYMLDAKGIHESMIKHIQHKRF